MDILVVEDDPVIGKSLDQGLREAGHGCVWVKDGRRGLEQAQTQKFDAVVLDLLLPGEPGLEVLGKLRTQGIKTPVIALTALSALQDRVSGLKAGADDYGQALLFCRAFGPVGSCLPAHRGAAGHGPQDRPAHPRSGATPRHL